MRPDYHLADLETHLPPPLPHAGAASGQPLTHENPSKQKGASGYGAWGRVLRALKVSSFREHNARRMARPICLRAPEGKLPHPLLFP